MKRNVLIIISLGIVLVGLGIGVYFLFFSHSGSSPVPTIPNPFATTGENRSLSQDPSGGPIQGAGTVVAPRLMRITDGPVAKGAVAFPVKVEPVASGSPTLSDTEIRYIDRASGNVYSFRVHDRVLARISNKTLPGIVEAVWLPDGSRAFARFLATEAGVDRVATYALPALGGEGFFLEPGLASVTVTGSSSIATLLPNANGSVATIATGLGTGARTLFSSTLSSILLQSAGADFVATTRAAATVEGYAFSVSGKSGAFTRILGPLPGLSTLPDPTGARVLYSYVSRGKVFLAVYDLKSRVATPLPVTTLAEKCAWTRDGRALYCGAPTNMAGELPDVWYQGAISFSDRIWRVDLDTRLATLIADPKQLADISLDMVALTVDPNTDVLVFTNKKDGSLWSYDF